MTTYAETSITCGACGHNFQHYDLSSTNSFGSMDLDARPSEMARSTMMAWIQHCPNCGYCAADASVFDESLRKVLTSPSYQAYLADNTQPPLAAKFICAALLLEAGDQRIEAGRGFLQVAWIMDDAKLHAESIRWRNRSAECLVAAMAAADMHPGQYADAGTFLVDCLRRANRGQEALPLIEKLQSMQINEVIQRILVFQQRLIMRGDIAAHTVQDAREPSL
jgi:hypothetical protein